MKPTLESLRNAGIKIWMLTGDKTETATCIAISSKLVSRNQPISIISKGIMFKNLLIVSDPSEALYALNSVSLDSCLVIDGESLEVKF